MSGKSHITLKSLHLDGHELPVPHGLEELLNKGNGWGSPSGELDPGYERKVIKENGRLITRYTYKGA